MTQRCRTGDGPAGWDRDREEPLASIYLACADRPRTAIAARDSAQPDLHAEEVEEALTELESNALVVRDGNLFVSLAIPASPGR